MASGDNEAAAALLASDPAGEPTLLAPLERRMHELDWCDPERAKVVRRYNALCDRLGVPNGDK